MIPEHRRIKQIQCRHSCISHQFFQLVIHLLYFSLDSRCSLFQKSRQYCTSGGHRIGSQRQEFVGISSIIDRTVCKYLHFS